MLGVSRSSVSLWVRDIELTAEQTAALAARNPAYNAELRGSNANAEKGRMRRRQYQEHGRRLARGCDAAYAAACMLYWAEGARNRHALRFTNSDPDMVRFFVRFLRTYFGVADDRITVFCNLYADHEARQREIEAFWLRELALPPDSLRKSTINVYSRYSQRKRQNMLPYGTCRVVVYDTRIVQIIHGSIQELAGFDRPAWIDMNPRTGPSTITTHDSAPRAEAS